MKRITTFLLVSLCANAMAQETLQTVTDRGNTTSNPIAVNSITQFGSRITAYGYNQGYFDVYNNTNQSISLNLKRSDGAQVFGIDGHSMTTYFGGKLGIGVANPSSMLDIHVGAGSTDGTVGLKIGSINNHPSLELGVENNYDAQIRTYGNDLNLYAGHFRNVGNQSTENHSMRFFTSKAGSTNWSIAKMILNEDGNLGIGIATPQEKLAVNGKIRAKEIKVEATGWPDYVFKPDYKLNTLPELEAYIKVNGHLPGVPAAAEVEKEGVALGEMNKILLKKIEEMTLLLIEKDKQLTAHEKKDKSLEDRLLELERIIKVKK
nr:hypothetical protein [Pedobacter chitinilyticus]